jgi:hypothetical protein
MDRHKAEGARDQFAAAWKAYIRANPALVVDENAQRLQLKTHCLQLHPLSDAGGGK